MINDKNTLQALKNFMEHYQRNPYPTLAESLKKIDETVPEDLHNGQSTLDFFKLKYIKMKILK